MLTVKAYAKVNLTLEVLGKREDGYHQIASVMQTIDLADELRFAPADQLTLRCNLPALETPDNLVLRAATLLREQTGYTGGAEIHLDKAIPLASGLGGGSSDAAATLTALNDLWELGLQQEELHSLAASVGSDVPFFLQGSTALVEGRGEVVQLLPPVSTLHLVLLAPPGEIPDKTATLYRQMTLEHYSRGEASLRLRRSIERGRRPSGRMLFNVFEGVAFDFFPSLGAYREAMLNAGAPWVHLVGSGPSLYTFGASKSKALALAEKLRDEGYEPYVAATVGTLSGETLPEVS